MSRIIKSEYIIFIILSLIFIIAGFLAQIHTLFNVPQDRINLGIHNYYADYHIYLSEITQGTNGSIFVSDKFTAEPHQKILFRPIFPLAGFLLKPLNLPPQIIYHLLRLFSVLLLFTASYFFLSLFLKTKKARLFAFFLAFASASFPKIPFRQTIEVYTFFNWWTSTSLPARINFIPHHTLANALLIIILILFVNGFRQRKTKFFLFAGLLGLYISLSTPSYIVLLFLFLLIYSLYNLYLKKINLPKLLIYNSSFLILSCFGLLYIYRVYQFSPWRQINDWVTTQSYNVVIHEYLLSLGPMAIFAILGIIAFVKSKKTNLCFPLTFLTAFFIILISVSLFPKIINPIRLIEVPISIFFSLFSVYFIAKIQKKLKFASYLNIALLVILLSLPAYKIDFLDPLKKINFSAYNYFPSKNLYQGLIYLKNNTKSNQVVLSMSTLGNIIPAISSNTVYLGHPVSTLNYDQKTNQVKSFYQGQMTSDQAEKFLNQNKISCIIWAFEEKPLGSPAQTYPFLKQIFANPDITIFTPKR